MKVNENCPECKGTGQYVGLNKVEPCSLCCAEEQENKWVFHTDSYSSAIIDWHIASVQDIDDETKQEVLRNGHKIDNKALSLMDYQKKFLQDSLCINNKEWAGLFTLPMIKDGMPEEPDEEYFEHNFGMAHQEEGIMRSKLPDARIDYLNYPVQIEWTISDEFLRETVNKVYNSDRRPTDKNSHNSE